MREIKYIVCADNEHFSEYSDWRRYLTEGYEVKLTDKSISYISVALEGKVKNAKFRRMLSQSKDQKDDVRVFDTKAEASDYLISLVKREQQVLRGMIEGFDRQLVELEKFKSMQLEPS